MYEADRKLPSPRVTLKHITAERVDLYRQLTPPGENIPIYVDHLPVEDLVPTKEKVDWTVRRFKSNHSRSTSGMMVENLWGCFRETRKVEESATQEEDDGDLGNY